MEYLRVSARRHGTTGIPNPPPDPNGRPSTAKRAAGSGDPLPTEADEGPASSDSKKSTDPHQPIPESLSDILQKSGSVRRAAAGSDILQMLGNPPTAAAGTGPP